VLRAKRLAHIGFVPTFLILFGLLGCLPTGTQDGSLFGELVLSAEPPLPPAAGRVVESEPNDTFASAERVYMETLDIELAGTMAGGTGLYDRDVYELGPANAGDRVRAELNINNGHDIVLGLFDDQNSLLAYIDQGSSTAGPHSINIVLRESTTRLYAVVDTRSASGDERAYSARVYVEGAQGIPADKPQIVVLAFRGAAGVQIGYRLPVNVPAFDATVISSRFAGQTDAVIHTVLEIVRKDYEGLNVEFYTDYDANIPAGERSTVYFGTYDSRLLGLADNIDPYNSNNTQEAILYTDTFAMFDIFQPSVEEISQVLANVASHEVGHLLGLRHTADVNDVMDVTASARQMMLDQWFKIAELDLSVLSIGMQDSPAMLSWAVGGQLLPSAKDTAGLYQRAIDVTSDPNDFYIPRSKLSCCSDHSRHPEGPEQ